MTSSSVNASSPRTSIVMSEMPPTTPNQSTVNLKLDKTQTENLSGATGSGANGNLAVATGNGNATRPSFREAALSFMKDKFEAFCGKLGGFKASVKEGLGEAKAYISAKIDSLLASQTPPATAQASPATAQASPATASVRTGPLPPVASDMTAPATDKAHAQMYLAVLKEANDKAGQNLATFLRQEPKHSESLAMAANGAPQNFAISAFNARPTTPLAFFEKTYAKSLSDGSGQALITSSNIGQVAANSAAFVVSTFERLVGSDATTARQAASNLSQGQKDLLATSFKAIDDSAASLADKAGFKENLLANVMLRTMMPAMATFNSGTSEEKAGFLEAARCMQTIMNTGSLPPAFDPNNTNPNVDLTGSRIPQSIHDALLPHVAQFKECMTLMLTEAASQGTPISQVNAQQAIADNANTSRAA